MTIAISLLLIIVSQCNAFSDIDIFTEKEGDDESRWNYGDLGPSKWSLKFPLCGGRRQSPVNIVTSESIPPHGTNSIHSHNFHRKFKGAKYHMINNGHALQIILPNETKYRLAKGDDSWVPIQVHIHFDPITGEGSEHTLNGRKFFAELHIVNRNNKYESKDDYMQQSDGLLVIAIFVELVQSNSSFAMSLFGNAALSLKNPGDTKDIDPFPLGWLLPTKPRKYSRLGYVNYYGSLTTPPCSEIVDWIIITGRTLEVSQELATNLLKVKNGNIKKMAGNNRPVQNLNDRVTFGIKGSF